MHTDPLNKAVQNLWRKHNFYHGDKKLTVVCLVRSEDYRPLKAPWWRGKEVYLIGADINGNFLLRHCDGSVRYWDHTKQTDEIIAPSIREFVAGLHED